MSEVMSDAGALNRWLGSVWYAGIRLAKGPGGHVSACQILILKLLHCACYYDDILETYHF